MDEDHSDLSAVESDDEFSVSGKKKSDKQKGYTVQKVLKVPRATTYTTQALYEQIMSNYIILDPEYQRDVVWPQEKQINLIDSILRNYYIPPVIFGVNTADDGDETRTCIDGKQRLTSIQRFMSGHIPHRDPITGEKLFYKDNGQKGRSKKLLPQKYRNIFANKQIVCVEYHDLTEDAERDIFQRVQLGMALTANEKMAVISTPRSHFIRQLLSEHVTDDGLAREEIKWDRARGSDFRTFLTAVRLMDNHSGFGSLSQLQNWLKAKDEPSQPLRLKVNRAFSTLKSLLDEKYSKAFANYKKPKVAPVELVGIIYLIATFPDLSLSELCNAIIEMRDHLQKQHKANISLNERVGKTIIDFIKEDLTSRYSTKKRKFSEDPSDSGPKKRPSLPARLQARK